MLCMLHTTRMQAINLICAVVQMGSTLEYTARMLYIATEYGAYDKS
jgi:hypothetical protein